MAKNYYDGMKGSPADAWSAKSTKSFSDKYEKAKKEKIVAPSEVVSSLFEAALEVEADWRHTDAAERVAKANAKTEDFYNGMNGSPADAWSPENTQRFSDEYEKAKKEKIVAPSEVVSSLFEAALEVEADWRHTDAAERVEQANKKAAKTPKAKSEKTAQKKVLIEEKKEQFKKDASLLKDMENNKKENNQGKAYWRTGSSSHPEQLGDFNRARIMTGPYNNQKEETYLTMSFASQMNEKTQEMYNRYFEAKKDPRGLDSDPTVKQWVKDGDEKAVAVINQNSAVNSQSSGTRYDDRAHQMALNNQRGR